MGNSLDVPGIRSSNAYIRTVGTSCTAEDVVHKISRKQSWMDVFSDHPEYASQRNERNGRVPLHWAVQCDAPVELIKLLLKIFPEAVTIIDAEGKASLHYAIIYKQPLEVLNMLLAADATCAELATDDELLLPIHLALAYRSNVAFIQKLLNVFPVAASRRTKLGKYALHYAAEYQMPLSLVQAIRGAYPEAIAEPHDRRLPLLYAAETRATFEVVQELYTAYKEGAEFRGVDGMLPIHLAVQHRAPMKVVQLLIGAYLDGLKHRDRQGRMPLHYAIERAAPDTLVLLIVKACPQTTTFRGHGSPGDFPLTMAIDKHYSEDVLSTILNANPAAAKEINSFNMLPLRCAIHCKSPLAFVEQLLHIYPDAAAELDEHYRLALHYAPSRNMPLEMVQLLLDAYPDGAAVKDKNFQVPLHLACTRKSDIAIVRLLLKAYPKGTTTADRYGFVPLNYLIEHDAPAEYFQLLLESDPSCAKYRCMSGKLPLHLAVEFRRSTEIISLIVAANPSAAADQERRGGRLPLHWAIQRKLPLESLLCIDDANPDNGASVADNRGLYLIHYAVKYPTPAEIVRRILKANSYLATCSTFPVHTEYQQQLQRDREQQQEQQQEQNTTLTKEAITATVVPSATSLRNRTIDAENRVVTVKDAYLLLHYAVDHAALPETVAEIMLYTMPYNTTTGELYEDHFDSWAFLLSRSDDSGYWKSIDIVLSHYEYDQKLIQKLADFPDRFTRRAVEVAEPKSLHEIVRRMYYFSRYETFNGLSIHKSEFCLIHSAIDHSTDGDIINFTDKQKEVVLKFSSHRNRFIREVNIRKVVEMSPEFVLPVKRSHNAQEDRTYLAEIKLKQYEQYPFLLVYPKAERDLLAIAKHEDFAGININVARHYGNKLLRAVAHIHELGVVHGDLRPTNIVRDQMQLKLTNLGAASRASYSETVSTDLLQLAYVPPELALMYSKLPELRATEEQFSEYINPVQAANAIDDSYRSIGELNRDAAVINAAELRHAGRDGNVDDTQTQFANDLSGYGSSSKLSAIRRSAASGAAVMGSTSGGGGASLHRNQSQVAEVGARLKADYAQDMWAVGAILYLLCTGESLFLTTIDENIDADQLALLVDWPDFVKQRRLNKVVDPSARSIISQLLNKQPQIRPSAAYCLAHPFFRNEAPVVRYVDMPASKDIFICYRRDTASSHAMRPSILASHPSKLGFPHSAAAEGSVATAEDSSTHDGTEADEHDHTTGDEGNKTGAKPKSSQDAALLRMFGTQALDSTSLASTADSDIQSGTATTDMMHSEARDQFDASLAGEADASNNNNNNNTNNNNIEQVQGTESGGIKHYRDVGSNDDIHCQLLHDYFSTAGFVTASGGKTQSEEQTAADTPIADRGCGTTSGNDAADVLMTWSSAAVIVLSRYSTSSEGHKLEKLATTSNFDQFYYEIRLAMELSDLGLLEKGIYVIAIGDSLPYGEAAEEAEYDTYFEQYFGEMIGRYGGSHAYSIPDVIVRSVERRIEEFLQQQGLGFPQYKSKDIPAKHTINHTRPTRKKSTTTSGIAAERKQHGENTEGAEGIEGDNIDNGDDEEAADEEEEYEGESLKDLMRRLVRLPTFHIIGTQSTAFSTVTSSICDLISGVGAIVTPATPYSRPVTGAFSLLDRSRVVTPTLRASRRASAAGIELGSISAGGGGIGGAFSPSASRAGSRSGVRLRTSSRGGAGGGGGGGVRIHTPQPGNLGSSSSSHINLNPYAAAAATASALGLVPTAVTTGSRASFSLDNPELFYQQQQQQQQQQVSATGAAGSRSSAAEVTYYQQQHTESAKQYTYYPNRTAGSPAATTAAAEASGDHLPPFSENSDNSEYGSNEIPRAGSATIGVGSDGRRESTYIVSSRRSTSRGSLILPAVSSPNQYNQQQQQQQQVLFSTPQSRDENDIDVEASLRASSPFAVRPWGDGDINMAAEYQEQEQCVDEADTADALGGGESNSPMRRLSSYGAAQNVSSKRGSVRETFHSSGSGSAMAMAAASAAHSRRSSRHTQQHQLRSLSVTASPLAQQHQQQQQIEFYNDDVKLPHLTEIAGVERSKTAETLHFLAEKLEVSENHVVNLEDELALMREKMRRKEEEVMLLRRGLKMHVQRDTLPPATT